MAHNVKDKLLVMKFGGTSVGTADAMKRVVNIINRTREDWSSLVVVISAVSGVTNTLTNSVNKIVDLEPQNYYLCARQLREIHYEIADQLIPDIAKRAQVKQELEHLINTYVRYCQAIDVLGEITPRAMDAIVSLGERMSVRLLTAGMQASGIPCQFVEATQLIITDDEFQVARPDFAATKVQVEGVLNPLLAQGVIPVVTGFIGATKQGITTTLGRGGSDYSAAILGSVLPSDEVWIWTDVDGVMTADPRIVDNAQTIPELSYREVAELAYFGAKVLHPKTIRPVVEAGIGLRVCNTFNPEHPGTQIKDKTNAYFHNNQVIKAVTAIRGQSLITIEGRGMLGVPGVAARAFGAVAETRTSVILISQASSEQSICFVVPVNSSSLVVDSLKKSFSMELRSRDIDRIWATPEIVIVTIVGAGLQHTPGIAGKVFSVLGESQINVIAIAQGSSEAAISLVVESKDTDIAIEKLHSLIIGSS